MRTVQVVVQDQRRFVREGLTLALGSVVGVEVVGTAATSSELVGLCQSRRPDSVVLTLRSEQWCVPQVVATLRRRQCALRVFGTYEEITRPELDRAHRAGVVQAIPESAGVGALVSALRDQGRTPIVTPVADRRQAPRPHRLTPRETEVLTFIARGCTAAEVAEALGISPKTVENRKQALFSKLGVQNQAHAVSVALRHGFLAPELSVSVG